MEYIWTIKMTNGDKYDVKANIQTIDKIIEIIFREGAEVNVTTFELHKRINGSTHVAIISNQVSSIEWIGND